MGKPKHAWYGPKTKNNYQVQKNMEKKTQQNYRINTAQKKLLTCLDFLPDFSEIIIVLFIYETLYRKYLRSLSFKNKNISNNA